ncbi:MAG: WYL domain-containing protein [Bacteroidetes bacterium]|jgi:predicted DNA-binding transcriptional regulator YafY|uniref:hypothetical protein n=1 Tax=Flavobacterium sp. TaxID=239 RepID=UPI002FD9FAD4|nr:WYL domain-containing protein [Bacteroidota bacterium]
MNTKIIEAIENQNVIEFYYDGELRVVEPHCYGVSKAGNDVLRAFQVDGYSSSNKMWWRMYTLSKMQQIQIVEDTFSSRNDYKRGDKDMIRIYREI